jgi:carbonic anhydrase
MPVESGEEQCLFPLLEQLIQEDRLLVPGAGYSLETGVVDFFDGVPPGV